MICSFWYIRKHKNVSSSQLADLGESRHDVHFTYRLGVDISLDALNTQLTTVTAIPDPAKAEQSFHMPPSPGDWGDACQWCSKTIMMDVEMAIATRVIAIVFVEVWRNSFHEMGVSKLEEVGSTISIQALIAACRAGNIHSLSRLRRYRRKRSSTGLDVRHCLI